MGNTLLYVEWAFYRTLNNQKFSELLYHNVHNVFHSTLWNRAARIYDLKIKSRIPNSLSNFCDILFIFVVIFYRHNSLLKEGNTILIQGEINYVSDLETRKGISKKLFTFICSTTSKY